MMRKIGKFWFLIILISAVSIGLAIAIPALANGGNIIEVSQPVQLTNDGHYERGQSIVYDGANYWLFYGRSASCTGTYQNSTPDGNDYALYYKKATTVAGLASAPATAVVGDTIQPTGIFNGETDAVFYDGKVWAFAPVDDPLHTGREALYGWYTTDGSSWTAVGPFWEDKLAGSLHHDEEIFNGELWTVEGAADGDGSTRHGDPYNPNTQAWIDTQLGLGLGASGGILHFFVEGGELYLAGLKCTAPTANIIYKYATFEDWVEVASTPSEGYDPTLFKVGSSYVFTQAPWENIAGGWQYTLSWSSSVLDSNFFINGPAAMTEGKYGANTWTDMWPIGFTDAGGNSYLFFTSERSPNDPSSEITGNIWYLPVTWDVTNDHYTYIQEAIDGATNGDTINVDSGTYIGAVVNKSVNVIGQPDGSSIIDTGVPFKATSSAYYTAFRPEADGCEIRNFTINCDPALDLKLAIYAIEVDNVTIDSLIINDNGTVQGITNWGGSNWVITNNIITKTATSGGGGIGIFVGAKAQQQCTGNLIQFNQVNTTATAVSYSTPGIMISFDTRYGQYDLIDGTEDISGNQILNNIITANGVDSGVGIEVGTILGDSSTDPDRTDPVKIAAIMAAAALHNNTVQGNNINGAYEGIYIFNVTTLTINQNQISNSINNAIYAEYAQSGTAITSNTFTNNNVQVSDDTETLDIAAILAANTFDRAVTVDHPGSSLLYTIWSVIQDGVDAAVNGDTINVAAGTYTETVTITPGADLTIQGAGRDITTWVAPADDPSRMSCIICSNANDTTLDISGFTFSVEDNAISTSGIALLINRADDGPLYLNIHDNKFVDTTAIPDETANSMLLCHNRFAARVGGEAPVKIHDNLDYTKGGIAMSNTQAFDIYNNTFDGSSDALYIGYGCPTNTTIGDHHIYNNTFRNASNVYPGGPWPSIFFSYYGSGTGMTFLPSTIENNTFEDNDTAIGYAMDSDIIYPADIVRHNSFANNTEAMIVSGAFATNVDATENYWGSASGPTHAGNTYNIGSQGDVVSDYVNYVFWLDTPGGTSFEPVKNGVNGYISIQAAIDDATDGDTITVAPGIYTEAIVINKQLTLRGATWNVNKNGYAVPANYAWDNTVESIIVHPNPTVSYYAIVDIVDIDNVTFEGFIVQELNAVGNLNTSLVRVYAHTRQITNITIRNNVIGPNTNVTSQDGTHGRMGLYIVNHPYSDQFGVVNSTFAGNKIFGCEGNGNNIFLWSSYFGYGAVGPASMSGTVIEDNEISGAHRSGIETAGGFSGLIIRDNNIFGSYKLPGDTPDLKYGNGILMIRGSGDRDNVEGYGPVDVTLENNNIYNNAGYGIYMGPNNEGITFTHNNVYNNGQGGIIIDLIGNYWNPDFEAVPGPHTNLNGSTDINAHFNQIYNNTGFGIQVIGEPTNGFRFNAVNNWWGTANPETVATKVSGAIDYDPWHLKAPVALAVGEVTADSIVLNWTTDGVWSGDYFDFRYATTPIITEADWNNAKRIIGEPVPVNGAQTMKIRDLKKDTTYYIVFSIADGTHRSDLSWVITTTLAIIPADNSPPSSVADLLVAAGTPSTTSVILTWTATGDDGANGFATKYIIKRSTEPINDANFNAATTVFNSLTPKASGETETFTVTRLTPDVRYYFAIKVLDEVPNTSIISNVVNIQTANLLPTISDINPATGDNGQLRTLTIEGNNFNGAGTTIVRLVNNQNTLTLINVNIIDNTHLTADVPKGAPTGTYNVRVTNNNGTSAPSIATYIITAAPVPLPVVTNVIPNMTAKDTAVDGVGIFGENFEGATAVTINGQAATIISVTATKITVNVPGMPVGEYDVKVTVPAAGTNDISAVKYIVTDTVVITNNSTDTSTSGVVQLTDNNIPVQLTLTTDNSENATENTDTDAEITVTIPSGTTVTDNNGNPYSGTLNPPRVVKPEASVQGNLQEGAVVIEMGNPTQTINFSEDFVVIIRITADSPPKIYYLNKTTNQYELAGKEGTKDGVNYMPGGIVLAVEKVSDTENLYTIGILCDHMSVYVGSTTSLLAQPTPPQYPQPPGGGWGAPQLPEGTTDISDITTTAGRFLWDVYAYSDDQQCSIFIPQGTIGLDENLGPLNEITILPMTSIPEPPDGYNIIGIPYDFGPSGATFDPAITITFTFDPTQIPAGADINDLKLAVYAFNPNTGEMEWTMLTNIQIDAETNTISGETSHFSAFAVIINIQQPAEFVLSALSISPAEAAIGESVIISLGITNTGDLAGTYDVTLMINDTLIETKQIELDGYASQTVTFTVSRDDIGVYTVSIGTLTGQFIVNAEAAPIPSTTPTTTIAATAPYAPTASFNWNIIAGIGIAAIIVIVALLYLWLRKRTA